MTLIQVIRRCVVCGKDNVTTVDQDKFNRWMGGEKIQDVWPEMSPDEREAMISGTCPKCWDDLWSEDA